MSPSLIAVPAISDVSQPQLQGLSDNEDDNGSNREYEDNSDDRGNDSKGYKKIKQLSITQC